MVVFQTMTGQGVMPNVIIHNALITGRKPEKALEVFESMTRFDVVLDVITYSAVISDCKKVEQPAQALDVFEAMKQQVAVPEVIAFHERRIKTECKINSTPILIQMRNI